MKLTKHIAFLLAVGMLTSTVASCGQNEEKKHNTALDDLSGMTYDEKSAAFYEGTLGEFYSVYTEAKAELTDLNKRYAQMAVAEAKLLEAGVMVPTTTQGGNYAIGRVAPYTVDFTLWGNDNERFHQALVATEPLTTEHRNTMKAKWTELRGTGEYEAWAKKFLADNGYTLKDTYSLTYSSDPITWDVLSTSLAADSQAIVNTYDGLLEYDVEGTLKPALAESYTVSDDGLVYTFKLRQGAVWTDSQGRKVADVKADDFVAGFQHMLDAAGGLEWLVDGLVVGASAYLAGETTDASALGVKAIDDYTVEYTLEMPAPYFLTMLGYGVFAPMSRTYYTSQGGQFGTSYDPSAASYKYGKDTNSIAYCGPYLVTNATANNTIVFKANESYWNKDNINVKTITWLFNDGSDKTKAYNDMKAGVIDGCSLNQEALEIAKGDGWFDKYHYTASTNATSYMMFFNVNRSAWANVNDNTIAVSTQTEEQKRNTNIAMNNIHFRRALMMSFDRAAWNALDVGEDLKLTSLRNSYTPYNFVVLTEKTKVDFGNGKSKTFPAGTCYGEIMQATIDSDNVKIKVYDPKADGGAGSGDGFDGWYNVDNCRAELEVAIKQLTEEAGLTISAENPIYLDLPYPAQNEIRTSMANAMKKSIEDAFEGCVVLNLVACNSNSEWYYTGYYTNYGYEANYDLFDLSGWGPDYGDPSTYLDTFLPDYSGYMTRCIGIY